VKDAQLKEFHDEAKKQMKDEIKKEIHTEDECVESLMGQVEKEFDPIKKINDANKNANELQAKPSSSRCTIL